MSSTSQRRVLASMFATGSSMCSALDGATSFKETPKTMALKMGTCGGVGL